jgi:hypothetical protein
MHDGLSGAKYFPGLRAADAGAFCSAAVSALTGALAGCSSRAEAAVHKSVTAPWLNERSFLTSALIV